jgi:hypothetical protein
LSRFRRSLPTSPDDPKLLEAVGSLGQQLDIGGLDIRDIRWMEWIPAGSDWCSLGRLNHSLIMPVRMIGRLTVEEWRPLIASSIMFEKKVRRRLRGKAFLLTGVRVVVSLAIPIAVAILLQMPWIISLYLVLALPLTFLGSRSYSRNLKKARLEADIETSMVIGKDSMLSVLKKIDTMGLDDIDRVKTGRGGRRFAGLPSITERIENLQNASSLDRYTTT